MGKKAFLVLSIFFISLLLLIGFFPGTGIGILKKGEGETAFPNTSLKIILKNKSIPKKLTNPLLFVSKSKLQLTLYEGNLPLKSYTIAMGENYTKGNKEEEGDRRTPEGRYYITDKRIVFPAKKLLGSRWLGVSYPAKKDVEQGFNLGLIDEEEYIRLMRVAEEGKVLPQKTPLGGEIGVHGGHSLKRGDKWTLGCIALTNKDVEELYNFISVGTPIIIVP